MKPYELPDLPYDYAALEPHYSARVLELHHDKHHAAYVKGVNTTLEKLAAARESGDLSSIVGLEKTLAFNLSGHVLHIGHRETSTDPPCPGPDDCSGRVRRTRGRRCQRRPRRDRAPGTVQGSGWGVLSWEPLGERLFVEQVYDHQGNVGQSGQLLLVLDAWEHAYYLQYENRRPEYVEAIWNVFNWADVSARFDRARDVVFSG